MLSPTILEQLSPSPEQIPGITARDRDVAVVAGAGSGKTRTLVARYLSLLEDGLPMRSIVAVTFTQKAALEMRSRIRQEIGRFLQRQDLSSELRASWQERYEALSSARIGTIHALCAEILHMHPAEAAIDPQFEMLSDSDRPSMITEIIEETLAWAMIQADMVELLLLLSTEIAESALTIGLDQKLEVSEAWATIDAGVWSKWNALIAKWFQQQFDQEQVRDDLGYLSELEARGLIDAAEAQGDKLADPLRQFLASWRRLQNALDCQDWSEFVFWLPELRRTMGGNKGSAKNWPQPSPKEALARLRAWYDDRIGQMWGRNGVSFAQDQRGAAALPALGRLLSHAWNTYARRKQAINALDFDDLEQLTLSLLSNPKHATVLRHWQSQVQALLVDEFQDTNHRQRDLLNLLNSITAPSDTDSERTGNKLFVVGDAKQSIYRFRGADVSVFRQERDAIRERGGNIHTLSTSYRGHPGLVNALNDLMRPIMSVEDDPTRPYAEPFAALTAHRQQQAEGLSGPYIEYHLAFGAKAAGSIDLSARGVADRLIELVEEQSIIVQRDAGAGPLSYGDVAILCRSSYSFESYENALHAAGIPYVTVAGRGFFDRPEVRDLLNLLTAVGDAADDLALAGALRSPAFSVSDHGLYRLCATRLTLGEQRSLWQILTIPEEPSQPVWEALLPQDRERIVRAVAQITKWREQVGRTTVADLLKRILDETHYEALLLAAGMERSQRNVLKLLLDAHASGLVGVGAFLEYIQGLNDSGVRVGEARVPSQGAVQIMSIHQAKGLEFPIVILGDVAGAGRNNSPAMWADRTWGPVLNIRDDEERPPLVFRLLHEQNRDEEEEESRRLLYVAATRARELLLISGNLDYSERNGTINSSAGWLKWMIAEEMLGLNGQPIPCNLESSQPLWGEQRLGSTRVACCFYPNGYLPSRHTRIVESPQESGEIELPLLAPFAWIQVHDQDKRQAETEPIRPGLHRSPGCPAHLIGEVVHQSLARWTFTPAIVAALADKTAKGNLLDASESLELLARAQELLDRFQQTGIFSQMSKSARRLHEVPFSMTWNDQVHHGRIDALFLDASARWHLVEIKSDRILESTSLADFMYSRSYAQQVRTYQRAIATWLGQEPITHLVLLDFHGSVRVESL